MQGTSEYREREHHNPEPTGASNTSTELEAVAQFLAIIHAEDALSERELAALVSTLFIMGDLPKTDKLTQSQRKRKRRKRSAEVSRQEKLTVP